MPKVLVPLARGFEEIEAVSIIDVLRRAGVEVVVASLEPTPVVQGAHDIGVQVNAHLNDLTFADFDMLVLPGGEPGTTNLADNDSVLGVIESFHSAKKGIGAICAAPRLLAAAGLLTGHQATSHPSVESQVRSSAAGYMETRVVRDGHILTSRGPGTALEFALEILRMLGRDQAAEKLEAAMLVRDSST